jgi:hypothetical protein
MAQMKYFADVNGRALELANVEHDGSIYTSAKHFSGLTPNGQRVQATRKIERKSNPSLHKCDARCTHAKGFKCECACGGANHARGPIHCEAT